MSRHFFILALGLLSLAGQVMGATVERKTRVDLAPAPLRAGTKVEEHRHLAITAGEYKVSGEAVNQGLALRFLQRVKLTRRIQSAENEDVTVEDFAEDSALYGATPPAVEEKLGPLNQTELRARRRGGQWLYELQKQRPSDLHAAALVKLSWMTTALEVATLGVGNQPRTTGETWKTDIPAPRGRTRGQPILSDYECTLESIEELEGVPHAKIAVRGKIAVEQPTYSGASELTFSGHVVRRLKDKVDVEMKVDGVLKFTGPVTAAGKPAKLDMNLPCTVTRTLRILPR